MRWPYRPRATRRPVGLLLAPAIIALSALTACGSLAANGQGSGGGAGTASGTAARHGGLCASRGSLPAWWSGG